MTTRPIHREGMPAEDPQARLERAFIKQYLAARGYQLRDLRRLPREQARALMTEACIYASTRLAEIETRSALINELHGDV